MPHGLMPAVGTTGRSRTVQHRNIVLFTQMSGDRNPLHYDVAAVTTSRFGGIIVQGGVMAGRHDHRRGAGAGGPGREAARDAHVYREPVR